MSGESSHSEHLVPTGDDRIWAILTHVLSIFFWILPGLIVFLSKKDDSPYLAAHAKEALNFQITIGIIGIVLTITIVGILFLWVPWMLNTILCIVAAIKASDNKVYRYPFTLRLVK